MPWKLGDKIIREGKGWVGSDGTKYSSLWARMTDAEKKAAGLTYVPDPKIWDNRFYWGWDAEEKNLIEHESFGIAGAIQSMPSFPKHEVTLLAMDTVSSQSSLSNDMTASIEF